MKFHTGISSGSLSSARALDLMRQVLDRGGDTVDLRADKGHRWEQDGLEAFVRARMVIAFVGTSVVLGDPAWETENIIRVAGRFAGQRIKVFSKSGAMAQEARSRTLSQVRTLSALAGGNESVLIETHRGFSSVEELEQLHAETGIRLVLDTLGLAHITPTPLEVVQRIAPMVAAVQVKGFDWENPAQSLHVPLSRTDISKTAAVLGALTGKERYVTVETKAGTSLDDLEVIHRILILGSG